MNKEIKEILDYFRKYMSIDDCIRLSKIEDCITNLQEEIERLKEIAHKMHLWIFLHSGDEQKVYDELGLTDEENAMLGYSGQFRIGEDKDVKN
jgi:hypothetical protein